MYGGIETPGDKGIQEVVGEEVPVLSGDTDCRSGGVTGGEVGGGRWDGDGDVQLGGRIL